MRANVNFCFFAVRWTPAVDWLMPKNIKIESFKEVRLVRIKIKYRLLLPIIFYSCIKNAIDWQIINFVPGKESNVSPKYQKTKYSNILLINWLKLKIIPEDLGSLQRSSKSIQILVYQCMLKIEYTLQRIEECRCHPVEVI